MSVLTTDRVSVRGPAHFIQNDTRTQIVWFTVNRYRDGIDLAGLSWSIHILNAAGIPDVAVPFEQPDVRGDKIIIGWLVRGTATAAAGDLTFNLRGVGEDENGNALRWSGGDEKRPVYTAQESEPSDEQEAALSELDALIEYVGNQLPGVILAGKEARAAANAANASAEAASNAGAAAASAANAAAEATANAKNLPYIGENGNWYLWDTKTGAYVDSGKPSRGEGSEGGGGINEETDPTVPNWAKAPNKPSYTAAEVGALPATYVPPNQTAAQVGADPAGTASKAVSTHNTSGTAHNDIRLELSALAARINAALNSDDVNLDQMAEIVAYIKSNKSLIDAITTGKVSVSDIVNNLTTNAANKPLSAAQGVALKKLIDAITVPTKLSQLAEDASHRLVTDAEKSAWSGKLDATALPEAVNTALAQAKESGEFDGANGQRGTGVLKVTTAPASYTTTTGGKNPIKRMAISTIESQAHVDEVLVGDQIAYSYYHYHVYYLDATYAYMDTYQSIRGASGTAGDDGKDGATYTPFVDASGNLSWSNNGGLDDPATVNIKGPKGDTPVRGTDYWTPEDIAAINAESQTYIDEQLADLPTGSNAPAYVIAEAERVADAVQAVRTAKSLVLLCASDIHTLQSNAQSVETTRHLAQGMSEICKRIAVDGIAILGDSAFGASTSTAEETKFAFTYLRENLAKGEAEIWIPGNHDHRGIGANGSYLSADELYSYIGANTTDKAVTDYDNLHRMYGYVDYDKQRIRVIYLNTSDITDDYSADYGMSNAQGQWLVDTLATVQEGWGVVVLSHHPLNGSTVTGLLTILDAYNAKQNGSANIGGAITYNFADASGEFICHLHGHIHNYQVKTLGATDILSITIPNGYFWRNNEYGLAGNVDWGDEVNGEQRVINKVAGTAEDTAFTAIVIDRVSNTVHALKYGAGIDRSAKFGGEIDDDIIVIIDWKDGYRFSSSSGNQSAQTGMTCGYLPMTDLAIGEGYRVSGLVFDNAAHANTYCTAYENDAYTSKYYALTKGLTDISFATYYSVSIAADGSYFEIIKTSAPANGTGLKVGVTGYGSGANAVVVKVSK